MQIASKNCQGMGRNSAAEPKLVAVVVDAPLPPGVRHFTYEIPDFLQGRLQPGHLVTVPFGDQTACGLITGSVLGKPQFAIRKVERLLHPTPVVSEVQLSLAGWVSETFASPPFSAVRLVMPPDLETWLYRVLMISPEAPDQASSRWREAHCRWFDLLKRGRPVRWPRARAMLGSAAAGRLYRHWAERGWLASTFEVLFPPFLNDRPVRDGAADTASVVTQPGRTPPTKSVGSGKQGRGDSFLAKEINGQDVRVLHAIYPRTRFDHYRVMIRRCVEAGKQALMLVPDRSQITDALAWLHLDNLRIGTWNRRQGRKHRMECWSNARAGKVDLIVGPRSALFLPLTRLGLIIVEQEQDDAYKNESTPRYRASKVAVELGRLTNSLVVLGSATPDAITYLHGRRGAWRLDLPAENATRRRLEILDLRHEQTVGRRGLLSRPLHEALGTTLSSRGRVILLLNRRGFARSLHCRDCGQAIQCSRCRVPTAVHGQRESMLCHYCGSEFARPSRCAQCGGARLRASGSGTEGLEDELQRLFPDKRVFRWDADTRWPPGGRSKVLASLARGEIDILVGAQGLLRVPRIPSAPLVAVVDADSGLHLPDFRAAEWVFRTLLATAALAEGTDTKPAHVFLQTRDPQHYCFRAFLQPRRSNLSSVPGVEGRDDLRAAYARFMAADAIDRRDLGYPPYGHLWHLVYLHRGAKEAEMEAKRCATTLRNAVLQHCSGISSEQDVEIIGPAPAYVSRLRDQARWHLFLRGPSQQLSRILEYVPRGWTIDTDPITLL